MSDPAATPAEREAARMKIRAIEARHPKRPESVTVTSATGWTFTFETDRVRR